LRYVSTSRDLAWRLWIRAGVCGGGCGREDCEEPLSNGERIDRRRDEVDRRELVDETLLLDEQTLDRGDSTLGAEKES
jgi:hypothetical protein